MAPARANAASIGFRVKTGRATAVMLTGSSKSPQILERRAVDLSDPRVPSSRQPYHAGLEDPRGESAPSVRRGCDAAHAAGMRVMREVLDDVRRRGLEPRGIGLVISSDSEPELLKNPHVRAHALEGRLFRDVLESAAAACGLPCIAIVERDAYERAAPALGLPAAELKRAVGALGAGIVKPWTAEEKTAALAAWVALARK